jgi:ABC-2 type transport system permease protein
MNGPDDPAQAGAIYDLGYQRYQGERLGRGPIVWIVFVDALRAVFGLGRSGRAKLVPWGLAGLALLPGVVALAVTTLAGRFGPAAGTTVESLFGHRALYGQIGQVLLLFAAAQGPELLVRDLRARVLSLIFSRPLARIDYVAAKTAAMASAIVAVILAPQLLLFLGRALSAEAPLAAAADDLSGLAPAVLQALVAGLSLAGVSLAVSSFTTRRGYATAAVIALFVVPAIASGILGALVDRGRVAGELLPYLGLFALPQVLDATNAWLFGVPLDRGLLAHLAPEVSAVAAGAWMVGSLAVLVVRYHRLEA